MMFVKKSKATCGRRGEGNKKKFKKRKSVPSQRQNAWDPVKNSPKRLERSPGWASAKLFRPHVAFFACRTSRGPRSHKVLLSGIGATQLFSVTANDIDCTHLHTEYVDENTVDIWTHVRSRPPSQLVGVCYHGRVALASIDAVALLVPSRVALSCVCWLSCSQSFLPLFSLVSLRRPCIALSLFPSFPYWQILLFSSVSSSRHRSSCTLVMRHCACFTVV